MKKRILVICSLLVLMLMVAACGKKEEVSTESIPVEQEETVAEVAPNSTESSQESVAEETADVEEAEDNQNVDEAEEVVEEAEKQETETVEEPKTVEMVRSVSLTQTRSDGNFVWVDYYDKDGDIIKMEFFEERDGDTVKSVDEYEYLLDENGNKIKGIDYNRAMIDGKAEYVSLLKNVKYSYSAATDSNPRIVKEYEYNENNQLIRMTDSFHAATNSIETYNFEHTDNKVSVSVTNTKNEGPTFDKIIMQFNEKGSLVYYEKIQKEEYGGGRSTEIYTYNDANQIVKEDITNENGSFTTEYIYDERGNLVSKKEDNSYAEYAYDENNNRISIKNYWTNGELYSATINEYDSDNNLLVNTFYGETEETVLTCSYDENGNLLVISVSDEPYYEFTYDEQGRLKKATQCIDYYYIDYYNNNFNNAENVANEYLEKRTGMEVGFSSEIDTKYCYEFTY